MQEERSPQEDPEGRRRFGRGDEDVEAHRNRRSGEEPEGEDAEGMRGRAEDEDDDVEAHKRPGP
jgi:hypothetical protein